MNNLFKFLLITLINLSFVNSYYAVDIITTVNNFKVFYCGGELLNPNLTPLKTESLKLDYCDDKLRLNVKHYDTEDKVLGQRCASKSVFRLIAKVDKTDSRGFCNTPEVRWYCDPIDVINKDRLPVDAFVCPEVKTVIETRTPVVKNITRIDAGTLAKPNQCGCCCNNGNNLASDGTVVEDITEYDGVKYRYDSYSGYYIPVESVE